MIYVAHGNNLPFLRKVILNQKIKTEGSNKTELNVNETSEETLYRATHSSDIFGGSPFVIFDISGAGNKDLKGYFEVVSQTPQETTLIILSSKKLAKTNIFIKNSKEINAKIITQEILPEGNTFRFADALINKNRNKTYNEMKKLMNEGVSEFEILGAVNYALTNIAKIKFNSPSAKNMQGFIKSKSMSQSKLYSEQALRNIFLDMYEIDKGVKTGDIIPEMTLTLIVEEVLNS